jgi:glycerol-3-phosphate dehydrogenase
VSERRQRVFDRWSSHVYDVLVVGGGITGAGVARDAALRGLSCALVEKGDFASGTSSRSGKLIHGGLRYLKHFHVRLVREACRERWLLLSKVAPHLVRPVRFVVPFYRTSRTPRWMMAAGLLLYDLLALFRTSGRFRFLSAQALNEAEPQLNSRDCVGGLSYWDCQCLDFRLVIDTLKSAVAAGTDALNYAELVRVERAGGLWTATVRDVANGREYLLRARTIVNAGGPWADDVQERLGASERFGLKITAGIHLVFSRRRLPVHNTLALEAPRDDRMIYVVPWGDFALAGTTDTFYSGDKDQVTVLDESVAYLLDALNEHFPDLGLTKADVQSSFVGLRPLVGSDQGLREDDLPRDDQFIVDDDGLVSITGGKLTTYRAMAQRVVDVLARRFFSDRQLRRCGTIAAISGGDGRLPDNASPRLRDLWSRYGSNALAIERLIDAAPEHGQRIDPNAPYLWAEVFYAVEYEFVERLDDLVERRLGAFLLAPNAPLAEKISRILGLDASGLIAHRTERGTRT